MASLRYLTVFQRLNLKLHNQMEISEYLPLSPGHVPLGSNWSHAHTIVLSNELRKLFCFFSKIFLRSHLLFFLLLPIIRKIDVSLKIRWHMKVYLSQGPR